MGVTEAGLTVVPEVATRTSDSHAAADMDTDNATILTIRILASLIMLLIMLLAIAGNILVICSVFRVHRLQVSRGRASNPARVHHRDTVSQCNYHVYINLIIHYYYYFYYYNIYIYIYIYHIYMYIMFYIRCIPGDSIGNVYLGISQCKQVHV